MAVVTEYYDDFSGGEIDAVSSMEFAANNWRSLRGFVFDNQRRLRSQWAGAEWDVQLEGS